MEVILKGLAVRYLLLLLLDLHFRLWASAAPAPRVGLFCSVPLLLVFAVEVGRGAGWQLHSWGGWSGVR